MNLLPEGGIPSELLSIVKYSGDTQLLEEECTGYVVEDEDEDGNNTGDFVCHFKSTTSLIVLLADNGVFETHAVLEDEVTYEEHEIGTVLSHLSFSCSLSLYYLCGSGRGRYHCLNNRGS
jgi:hypothetical protein